MRLHFVPFLLATISSTIASQMEQIPLPADKLPSEHYEPLVNPDGPSLADVLTIQHSASIFYSYARETTLSQLFTKAHADISLFVPINKAVMALARKPHQGPLPVGGDNVEISQEEYDTRSRLNVENWVSAHVVPEARIDLSIKSTYPTLFPVSEVSIEPIDGNTHDDAWKRVVLNGNISIINKISASNGDLYLLDGALYG